jgi:hypothetical protein
MYSDNDYSDIEEDDYTEDFPEWFLIEQEFFRKMSVINKFKKYISKQPAFIGIINISDVEIFNYINDKKLRVKRQTLEDYEITLFDDLYKSLFGEKGTLIEYESVFIRVTNRCYV